ncbi:MAG: hypothetical protein ACI959_000779, partial [Limisphaerales bacterium]
WKHFLRIIIILNVLYSLASLIMVIQHSKQLTQLGIAYFIIEIIIIGTIVFIEYKSYLFQKSIYT